MFRQFLFDFVDENSIDFIERLLDDRRSLDDTFIVSARMRDVEKTLKNLDRVHKIRVRRCSASTCSKTVWTSIHTINSYPFISHPLHVLMDSMDCKLLRKCIEKSNARSNKKTIAKSSEHRGSGPSKMELREGLGGSGKPWGSLWGSPGEPLGRPRGGLGVPLGSRLDELKENLGRTPWRTPKNPRGFEAP